MSERLYTCQALAAMMHSSGGPSEDEASFVGHAALDLGLNADENAVVLKTLRDGGEYERLIAQVNSRPARHFLFRRVVAATLLDAQIDEKERAFIDRTAKAFNYSAELVEAFIGWMREGIAWEQRGAALMARL